MKNNSIFNLNNAVKMMQNRIPGQVVVQFTDSCNATCPQCAMRKTNNFKRSKLDEQEIKKIIDHAAKNKFQALSFTGGEPFIYKDELLRNITYATQKGIPLIRTGTNAFFLADYERAGFEEEINELAEELSKTNLRNLWISIDSADPETHENMRGLPGVIKGIEKALPIFHKNGIFPAANLGINRNTGGEGKIPSRMTDEEEFYNKFKESFEKFYEFVIELGFTMANACYPMDLEKDEENDINPIYGATSPTNIVSFTREEKVVLFKALSDVIPKYRSRLQIFTPLNSLYSLIKEYEGDESFPFPCRGGIDFFFVEGNTGNTYPCGFRGNDNFGKFYDIDFDKIENEPYCKLCDWECFRDPSEQIGYLLQKIHHPFNPVNKKDKTFDAIWKEDLNYYKKCNYFDGRIKSI